MIRFSPSPLNSFHYMLSTCQKKQYLALHLLPLSKFISLFFWKYFHANGKDLAHKLYVFCLGYLLNSLRPRGVFSLLPNTAGLNAASVNLLISLGHTSTSDKRNEYLVIELIYFERQYIIELNYVVKCCTLIMIYYRNNFLQSVLDKEVLFQFLQKKY